MVNLQSTYSKKQKGMQFFYLLHAFLFYMKYIKTDGTR